MEWYRDSELKPFFNVSASSTPMIFERVFVFTPYESPHKYSVAPS